MVLLWIAFLITSVAFMVLPLKPGFENSLLLSICCCLSAVTMSYAAAKPIINQKEMRFQKGVKNHASNN